MAARWCYPLPARWGYPLRVHFALGKMQIINLPLLLFEGGDTENYMFSEIFTAAGRAAGDASSIAHPHL